MLSRASCGLRAPVVVSLLVVAVVAVASPACQPTLPAPPAQCDAAGKGCLPDEQCVAGTCQPRPKCETDDDCESSAYRCVLPTQICALRPGFGTECSVDAPCDPGSFCALGRCRLVKEARPCSRHFDCPAGQACDRETFFCIEEGPCTFSTQYPELACDPDEQCDELTQRCRLQCQNECKPETEEQDCGADNHCDGACRCVQCVSNDQCGAGLVCNTRAGRCESEHLCFADDDCEKPLRCDPRTALCQVPPPPCDDDLDCQIAEICNRDTGACELPGGTCIDDRLEEDDTPKNAVTLEATIDGVIVDELSLCPGDDDVYAVALPQGAVLSAQVLNALPQARATVWLLDASGETSLRVAETPPRGDGKITYVAQRDETLYVRVSALVAATPYDLKLTRATGQACQADLFEGPQGNDTVAHATAASEVPLGTPLNGTLCRDDVDFLQVALEPGEGIEASLAFQATTADLDLAILDQTTGEILARSDGLSSPEEARARLPTGGNVLVRVQGFANSFGPYQLRLEKLPLFVCRADAQEPDDGTSTTSTTSTTTTVAAGQTLHDVARTLCVNDVDQYAVPLADFERLVVRAVFDATELAPSLEVLDAAGARVLASAPAAPGNMSVTYDARGNETVVVRLRALHATEGAYTLTLFRENQLSCEPDDVEPNDVAAQAKAVPAATQTLTLCGSDEDYFSFDGAAGKVLVARASFLHADGDLDLQLASADGRQLLASVDGIGDGEELSVILPLDGAYTLRVFSLSSSVRSRYTLDVHLADPP